MTREYDWRKAFLELKDVPEFADAFLKWKCPHEHRQFTRFVKRNGVTEIRPQCLRCGGNLGGVKSADLRRQGVVVEALPLLDEELASRWMMRRAQVQAGGTQPTWWDLYERYLRSPRWKSKRERVLQRDGHRCQNCLSQAATEVHHLSYGRIGDEPLFDLISICWECHVRMHPRRVESSPKPSQSQIPS